MCSPKEKRKVKFSKGSIFHPPNNCTDSKPRARHNPTGTRKCHCCGDFTKQLMPRAGLTLSQTHIRFSVASSQPTSSCAGFPKKTSFQLQNSQKAHSASFTCSACTDERGSWTARRENPFAICSANSF